MGHLLKEKEGAVFFVDILGFSALTQDKIKLKDSDFDKRDIPYQFNVKHNQLLAALILVKFRKILDNYKNRDVRISQLSDGAFIWSENICDVIIVAHDIMWNCIKGGILCRGGLSCGDFIETDKEYRLGRLILGSAVTEAAKLESSGVKGMRILINTNLNKYLKNYDKKFYGKINTLFQPIQDLSGKKQHHEFRWYDIPKISKSVQNLKNLEREKRINAIRERFYLAALLKFDSRFAWNEANDQGKVHIQASLDFILANEKEKFEIENNIKLDETTERSDLKIKHVMDLFDDTQSGKR